MRPSEKCRVKDYLTFFRESYDRAIASGTQRDEFFEAFYDSFMSKSDEITARFANTDMPRQKEMLDRSLHHMVEFSVQRRASEQLRAVAERHSMSQLDIDPGLYDVWLQSLIETVQMFDSRFTEEIELAWRVVLAPGIVYMKFKYDKPAAESQLPFIDD